MSTRSKIGDFASKLSTNRISPTGKNESPSQKNQLNNISSIINTESVIQTTNPTKNFSKEMLVSKGIQRSSSPYKEKSQIFVNNTNVSDVSLKNKSGNDSSFHQFDPESEFNIPRNINSYKHLYDTCKLNFKEINWVLNLRDESILNKTTFSKRNLEPNPPRFFQEDLDKHYSRIHSNNPREIERKIYDPNKTHNNLHTEHLIKNRLGPSANQTQVSFETSLRQLPDLTIPSGRHPDIVKKFKHFENKKFKDIPYYPQEKETTFSTPKHEKFLKTLNNLKDNRHNLDLVTRPIKYKLEKIDYDGSKILKKKLEYSKTQTKPFMNESFSMPFYNEKYGRPEFDNSLKEHKHCLNSLAHFQFGLRSDITQDYKLKKNQRDKLNAQKSKDKKAKPMFWINNPPVHYDRRSCLIEKGIINFKLEELKKIKKRGREDEDSMNV